MDVDENDLKRNLRKKNQENERLKKKVNILQARIVELEQDIE